MFGLFSKRHTQQSLGDFLVSYLRAQQHSICSGAFAEDLAAQLEKDPDGDIERMVASNAAKTAAIPPAYLYFIVGLTLSAFAGFFQWKPEELGEGELGIETALAHTARNIYLILETSAEDARDAAVQIALEQQPGEQETQYDIDETQVGQYMDAEEDRHAALFTLGRKEGATVFERWQEKPRSTPAPSDEVADAVRLLTGARVE